MDRARAAEATVAVERGVQDFVVRNRCGVRSLEDRGYYNDAVQGQGRTEGTAWARKRGLQITYQVTWSKNLSEENSRALARAWTHRMQYFYDLCKAAGDDHLVITPVMRAA